MWSSPSVFAQRTDGTSITGPDGDSIDVVFKRSASNPGTPSASAGVPTGWSTTSQGATGTDLLWASVGTKAGTATNYTWQTPYQVEGTAVAEIAVYRKNNSSGNTGGSYNFSTSTLTTPTNWSTSPPSLTTNGDIVYVIVGTASGGPLETSASIVWSSPSVFAQRTDGTSITGPDGDSIDVVFKRSASNPGTPSASAGVPTGWSTTSQGATGTDLLWASVGTKAGTATNYTWQTPYQVEGTAVAEIAVYRKNNSSGNTGGSYNFSTSTLTTPTNWSTSPPSLTTNGDIVYVIVGTASGGPLETSASIVWSSPSVFAQRTDGTSITGPDGDSIDVVFKRSASNPGTPSASAGVPTGWSTTSQGATGTDLLWASVGTKAGTATNYTWQTPYQVEGTAVAEIAVYRKNNSSGNTGGSYNFSTSTLTTPTNWSTSPPSLTTNGDIVYVIVGTASGGPLETSASIVWSSPSVFSQKTDGADGGTVNFAFKRSTGTPGAPTDTSEPVTYPSNGWYDDASNATGAGVLYAIKGTLSGTTWTWGTAYALDGAVAKELYIYNLNVQNPTTNGSYKFADTSSAAVWTTPTGGWSKSPPSLVSDGDIVYVSAAVVTGNPGSTLYPSWSLGVVHSQRKDGEGNILATLSNPNVIITANNDGTVPSGNFAGSGTVLQVFEGSTPLDYHNNGNGTGQVAIGGSGVASSGLTRGNPVQTGSAGSRYAVYGDISALTVDTGTITFNITGFKLDGTAITPFSIVQSFSKTKAGISGNTGFLFVTALPSASNYEVGQVVIVEASAGAAQQGYIKVGASWVARDIVNHDIIFADAIRAEQLEISSSVAGGSSIFMNSTGTNNSIEIYDSGTLRVKIGKL